MKSIQCFRTRKLYDDIIFVYFILFLFDKKNY